MSMRLHDHHEDGVKARKGVNSWIFLCKYLGMQCRRRQQ